jgi:hypothetical protein
MPPGLVTSGKEDKMPSIGTNGYWWVVGAVVVVCAIIWAFRRYRSR